MRVTPEQEKVIKRDMARPPTTFAWYLEGIAVLAIVLPFAYLLAVWSELPATVPTHFDTAGNADGFGSRTSFFGLIGVQVSLYLLLTFMRYMPARFYNLPATVTESNLAQVSALLRRFPRVMKAALSLTFGMLIIGTIRVALARATTLSPWLPAIGMVGVLGAVIWLLVETSRISRAQTPSS